MAEIHPVNFCASICKSFECFTKDHTCVSSKFDLEVPVLNAAFGSATVYSQLQLIIKRTLSPGFRNEICQGLIGSRVDQKTLASKDVQELNMFIWTLVKI